jgi:hypothetical protein
MQAVRQILRAFGRDLWATEELADSKQKLWDIRLKIVAVIGVIVAAWWAVLSYNTTAERELRKGFWDKQIGLYFDAAEAASTIAILPPDDPGRQTAVTRFWQLYFGPLRVVEDDENVGNAMVAFGLCLTEPGNSKPMSKCDQAELEQEALRLAVSCRRSIAANWNRKLAGLNRL